MQPDLLSSRSSAVIVPAMGLGQVIAFASSFYLMGALGDPIARDLHLPAGLVFGLVSLSPAAPAFTAPPGARRIDEKGGKAVLLASNLVFALGLVQLGMATGPLTLAAAML